MVADAFLTPAVLQALAAPFGEEELEFLPRGQANGKALALPYIDARSVMRRLDEVVGPANWSFDFDLLSDDGKRVRGRLTVCGVTKCDAGEAGPEDEPLKAAVSDALKRCAVHFGVGRYLYYLPRTWLPFDAQKRRFSEAPRLPAQAVDQALSRCGLDPSRAGQSLRERSGDSNEYGSCVQPPARTDRAPSAPISLQCEEAGCHRTINRAQYDVSRRKFGRALCPTCQRSAQPDPAAAAR